MASSEGIHAGEQNTLSGKDYRLCEWDVVEFRTRTTIVLEVHSGRLLTESFSIVGIANTLNEVWNLS